MPNADLPPRTLRWTRGNTAPLAHNPHHAFAHAHALCLYRAGAIYTYIPKNACSTMRFSVALHNGAIRDESEIQWIHKNNPTFMASLAELATARFTFVILRDPFTRIASCFLDKIVGMTPEIWGLWSALDRPWDIKDLSFRGFIESVALMPQLNEHWRPQSDFLVYDDYDAWFAFENMDGVAARLRDRIGLDVRDTRALVRHGSDRFAPAAGAQCHADTAIGDLLVMKNGGQLPRFADMYDAGLIARVGALFADDVALYRERCGRSMLSVQFRDER